MLLVFAENWELNSPCQAASDLLLAIYFLKLDSFQLLNYTKVVKFY